MRLAATKTTLAVLVGSGALLPARDTPTLPRDAQVVLVDLVARDRKGQQVADLRPDERRRERATFEIGAAEAAAAVAGDPPPVPPDLVPVLERAARYVLDYEQAFHDIAAEEAYTQWTGPQRKMAATGLTLLCTVSSCRRTTRADVVFVRLGGEIPWGTFRDVSTQYRAEPKLAMWVPAEMREEYEDLTGTPVFHSPSEAAALYSNFRKFTVTIEDVTASLPGEPAEPPLPLPPVQRTARAQAPQVPPTFPSSVELITVDAVVLDKEGQPLPGLTKDDFVVKEDGRPRDVVSFEAFDVGAAGDEPEAAAPGVVASNEPATSDSGRGFAIVVDDLRTAPERMPAAQETVKLFLERSVRDGDLVTLTTTSGNAWWSARVPEGREDLLAVLARARGRFLDASVLDRMSDYEAFWIANREDSGGSITARVVARWEKTGACPVMAGRGSVGCDGKVRARATHVDGIRQDRLRPTLACVRRAIEALAPVRGRKSLLLLSEGFLEDFGGDARAVAALSREANTAVYFVDVRGLEALPGGFASAADAGPPPSGRERFEATTLESAGAVALADDTGGFSVRNTNDLAAGVRRVGAESRVFYLLGFYPSEGKAPGQWRNLRVEVDRPGLTVRARRGYTLRSEMTAAAPAKLGKEKRKEPALDPAVARALDSPHTARGIRLRAMAYVLEPRPKDTVHVLVAAELDPGTVGSGGPATRRLETSAVALLRDTGRGFRHEDTVAVTAARGDEPRWRAFTREFELPPGVAQVRVVVRDPATGTIGSVVQRIEVPSASEFRISTPILTDRIEPATARGQLPQPALVAHRDFPAGGGLYCRYEVFGAARPGGTLPRVVAGFQMLSPDGVVVQEAAATPIAPDSDGRLVRLVGVSLEGLPEGPYQLVIKARDEATGKEVVRHDPFILSGSRR